MTNSHDFFFVYLDIVLEYVHTAVFVPRLRFGIMKRLQNEINNALQNEGKTSSKKTNDKRKGYIISVQ